MFPIQFVLPVGTSVVRTKLGRWALKTADNIVEITPSNSPVWQNMQQWRGKTKMFEVKSRKYQTEWDFTHGDIEVYTWDRKHIGSIDPITGKLIKGPKHPK